MKVTTVKQSGTKGVEITLDKKIFGIKENNNVVFDAIVSQQASLRQVTASVKNRSAVSGGGKKPWKQKGTGRARQGTIRAPQWVGGGVVFGPRTEANYTKKVNKKVRKLAIKSLLTKKAKAKEIIVVDKIVFKKPSTKEMIKFLKTIGIENKKALVITSDFNENIFKSLTNLRYADHVGQSEITVLDLAHYDHMIITTSALDALTKRLA